MKGQYWHGNGEVVTSARRFRRTRGWDPKKVNLPGSLAIASECARTYAVVKCIKDRIDRTSIKWLNILVKIACRVRRRNSMCREYNWAGDDAA